MKRKLSLLKIWKAGHFHKNNKQHLFMKRARRIAMGGYGIKIVRQAFTNLRKNALKSVLLK